MILPQDVQKMNVAFWFDLDKGTVLRAKFSFPQ
jgi:hypothetical protein